MFEYQEYLGNLKQNGNIHEENTIEIDFKIVIL